MEFAGADMTALHNPYDAYAADGRPAAPARGRSASRLVVTLTAAAAATGLAALTAGEASADDTVPPVDCSQLAAPLFLGDSTDLVAAQQQLALVERCSTQLAAQQLGQSQQELAASLALARQLAGDGLPTTVADRIALLSAPPSYVPNQPPVTWQGPLPQMIGADGTLIPQP